VVTVGQVDLHDVILDVVSIADFQTVMAIEQDVFFPPDGQGVATTIGQQAGFEPLTFCGRRAGV